MHRLFYPLNFLLFILLPIGGVAQLTGGNTSNSELASDDSGISDSVFIFNVDVENKFVEAFSPNGGEATFQWRVFNTETNMFEDEAAESGESSRFTILESTGIEVIINEAGTETTNRCWALINEFSVHIISADTTMEGEMLVKSVPGNQRWCSSHLIVGIRTRIDSSKMSYTNWDGSIETKLPWNYSIGRFSWSSNPEPEEEGINTYLNNSQFYLNIDISYPHWEDSWYTITIQDDYGLYRSDSVFHESLEPHADFSFEHIALDNSTYYPEEYGVFYGPGQSPIPDYDHVSAPAKFLCTNESVNADTLYWSFGDTQRMISAADSIVHTYDLPGVYSPMLIVKKWVEHQSDPCVDTFPKIGDDINWDDYIASVEEVNIETIVLPNVLSCPGGENNIFRFTGDVSITYFEIAVFNRFGNRVYHFEGDIRDWQGWDGRKNNSDRYVKTGIYYYAVRDLNRLPLYETGRVPRITFEDKGNTSSGPGTGTGTGTDGQTSAGSNEILRGFVHVYNTEN